MKDALSASTFLESATLRAKDLENPEGTHALVVDLLDRIANGAKGDAGPLASGDLLWAIGMMVATVLSSTKRDEVPIAKIAASFTTLIVTAMEALETLEQDWTRLV